MKMRHTNRRDLPAWVDMTARSNRRFNQSMDLLTLALILLTIVFMAAGMAKGWMA